MAQTYRQRWGRKTGDTLLREWIGTFRRIKDAEEYAGITVGYIRVWMCQDLRRFGAENAKALAIASDIPFIALMFRHEEVVDLLRGNPATSPQKK